MNKPNAKSQREFLFLMKRCVNVLTDEDWEILYEEQKKDPTPENIQRILKKFIQNKEEKFMSSRFFETRTAPETYPFISEFKGVELKAHKRDREILEMVEHLMGDVWNYKNECLCCSWFINNHEFLPKDSNLGYAIFADNELEMKKKLFEECTRFWEGKEEEGTHGHNSSSWQSKVRQEKYRERIENGNV